MLSVVVLVPIPLMTTFIYRIVKNAWTPEPRLEIMTSNSTMTPSPQSEIEMNMTPNTKDVHSDIDSERNQSTATQIGGE